MIGRALDRTLGNANLYNMRNRISIAAARKDFANVVRSSAQGERIKLTRYNTTLAVLIPKEDLAELERCEEEKDREPALDGQDRDGHRR